MTKQLCRCFFAALIGTTTVFSATPASAQYLILTPTVVDNPSTQANQQTDVPAAVRPSLFRPFTDALGDFRRLPSRTNAGWLVVGLALAGGARMADRDLTEDFGGTRNRVFRPGATIGGMPFA